LARDDFTEMDPLQIYKKLFPNKQDVVDREIAFKRPEVKKVLEQRILQLCIQV
jgi:hypothetical protein